MSEANARIVRLELDQKSIVRWSPEVEHERSVAIFDLLLVAVDGLLARRAKTA